MNHRDAFIQVNLVDTSVCSLALRRNQEAGIPQVCALRDALEGADVVVTTGLEAPSAAV